MLTYEKVLSTTEASFTCYLRGAREFPFEWHYHPEYELIAVTASSGRKYVGDNVSDYAPGDIALIGPDLPHTWQSTDDSGVKQEAVVVQFGYGFLGDTLFDHEEFMLVRKMLERSERGLAFVGDEFKNAHSRIADLVQLDGVNRVLELLSILVELSSIPGSRTLSSEGFGLTHGRADGERINASLKYMYDHIEDSLSQKDVAEAVNMSPSGFSRFFKRCTGRNFVDCLNDMRVGYACRLLIDSDETITEICFRSGFRNISNFNRQFLKHRKMSPRRYRSAYRLRS